MTSLNIQLYKMKACYEVANLWDVKHKDRETFAETLGKIIWQVRDISTASAQNLNKERKTLIRSTSKTLARINKKFDDAFGYIEYEDTMYDAHGEPFFGTTSVHLHADENILSILSTLWELERKIKEWPKSKELKVGRPENVTLKALSISMYALYKIHTEGTLIKYNNPENPGELQHDKFTKAISIIYPECWNKVSPTSENSLVRSIHKYIEHT